MLVAVGVGEGVKVGVAVMDGVCVAGICTVGMRDETAASTTAVSSTLSTGVDGNKPNTVGDGCGASVA